MAQAPSEVWALVGSLVTALVGAIIYIVRQHGGKVVDAAAENIKRGGDARLAQIQADLDSAKNTQTLHAESLKAVVDGQKEMFGLMRNRDDQLAHLYDEAISGMQSRMDRIQERMGHLQREVEINREVLKEIQNEGMLRQQELFSEVVVSIQAVMAALNELSKKVSR